MAHFCERNIPFKPFPYVAHYLEGEAGLVVDGPMPTVGASPPLTAKAAERPPHPSWQTASAGQPPLLRRTLLSAVLPLPPPPPVALSLSPFPTPSPFLHSSHGPFCTTGPTWCCRPRIDDTLGHGVGRVCSLRRWRSGVPPGRVVGSAARTRLPPATRGGGRSARLAVAPRPSLPSSCHISPLHGHGRNGH